MNTPKEKGLMRVAAECSLCNLSECSLAECSLYTKAGSWDNMLARLEIEDMLAPAYFVTRATNITCMLWS